MEFGTWYQINCERPDQWREDFATVRQAGFDFVVLWNIRPAPRRGAHADLRPVVRQADLTLRSLEEVGRAGLAAYLGVWHPHCMGPVPAAWRPRWSDGRAARGPNIFNEDWLRGPWRAYLRSAGRLAAAHPACRGVYLDDTFPAMPSTLRGYLSYTPADCRRFRRWLRGRYGDVANLNMTHKLRPGFRSFAAVQPPRKPLENLALWSDWMHARADWCEDFARLAAEAFRPAAGAGGLMVLSDQDYHMLCTPLQYAVDYARLMKHLDRFEIYMAARHQAVGRRALLGNVRRIVRTGRRLAGAKPFQFHTWFADPAEFRPMDAGLLTAMMDCAAEEGAAAIEVYTFKVHDWRAAGGAGVAAEQRPPFKAVSLKYNADVLKAVARAIRRLR